MLPFHGRWRNASKRAPEREARLLMFSNQNPDHSQQVDNNDEELPFPTEREFLTMPKDQQERWNTIIAARREKREQEARKRETQANVSAGTAATAQQVSSVLANAGGSQSGAAGSNPGTAASPNADAGDAGNTQADERNEVVENDADTISYQETLATSDEMVQVIGGLLHQLRANKGTAKQYLSEDEYTQWQRLQDDVAIDLANTQKDRDFLEIIGQLEENEKAGMPPNGVIAFARRKLKRRIEDAEAKGESATHYERYMALLDKADDVIQGRGGRNRRDVSTLAEWQKLNDEQKLEVYDDMRDAMRVDEALALIKEEHKQLLEFYDDDLKKTKDKEDAFNSKKRDIAGIKPSFEGETGFNPLSLWKAVRNLPANVGIEFYSPLQVWEAFKQVKEVMEGIKKKKDALKIASFADSLGGLVSLIPKYKNAKNILSRSHEEENDKIKKGYKEALGSSNWQPGYDELFKPGGVMDQNLDDKNMTMAILEYTAGKGMIYNMKETDWKTEKILGRWYFKDLVPSHWSEGQIASYHGNVAFDNEAGEKKQEKNGYDNNVTFSKVPQFMKELNDALEGKDLWYARGVVKRAMEKVDTGHMASIIAVTIMRQIEKNPMIGKIMPSKWLDQIGGEGKELNVGLVKFEHPQILAWAKRGSGDIREIPRLGNFMADVREYLIKQDPTLGKNDPETIARLDKATAQLMSCETIEVGKDDQKKTVTIYDKRFNPYVGEILKDANWVRGIPMEKGWDDFFVNPSEFQRGSQTVYDTIFKMDVTGSFAYEPRTRFFISWLERTHQEILKGIRKAKPEDKQALREAEENFRNEIRGKMDASMLKVVNNRVNASMAKGYKLEYHNAPVFVALIEQGMLSLSVFEEAIEKNAAGIEFAKAVVEQCMNRGLASRSLHSTDIFDERNFKESEREQRKEERERALAIEDRAKAIRTIYQDRWNKGQRRRKNRNNPPSSASGADHASAV